MQSCSSRSSRCPSTATDGGFDWALEGAHSRPRVLHVEDGDGRADRASDAAAAWREPRRHDPHGPRRARRPADALARLAQTRLDRYRPPACRRRVRPSTQRRGACDTLLAQRDDPRDRRPRPGLPPHDQPGRRARRRHRDGVPRRARAAQPRSSSSSTRRARTTRGGGSCCPRRCAARARGIADGRGQQFMTRLPPGRRAGAARRRRPRASTRRMLETGPAARPARHLATSRRTGSASGSRARRPLPRGRLRPDGRPVPVVPAAHYSLRRHRGGRSTGGRASAGCAPSARCRAPASTARTGWPRRRCSKASLWGMAGRPRRCGARRERRARGGMSQVGPWEPEPEPVDPALIAQDWLVIRHTMWNYVGLVRSGRRLDRARRILQGAARRNREFLPPGAMSDALVGLRNGVRTALEIPARPRTTASRRAVTTGWTGRFFDAGSAIPAEGRPLGRLAGKPRP